MRRLSAWLLLVCAGAFTPTFLAHAQEQQFERGLRARSEERWPEVVAQMNAAIQIDGKESDKKIGRSFIGTGGTEYLPFFFLGEAYFRQNDCARAVDAWYKSEQQGIVKTRPDFLKTLMTGNASCEMRGVLLPGKYESAHQGAQKVYEEVNNLAGRVSARGEANIVLWRNEMRQTFDRAAVDLRESYEKLNTGAASRLASDFLESRNAAERARVVLSALETELNTAIETNRSIQQQVAEIEQLLKTADGHDRDVESKKAFWGPSHAAAVKVGRDALGRGRERLQSASRAANGAMLTGARDLALEASARLKVVLEELVTLERLAFERTFAEALTAAQEVFSFIEGGFGTFDELVGGKPDLLKPEMEVERGAIEGQVSSAVRRLENARKTENLAGVREATRLAAEARDRLNALITTFGPLTLTQRGVHPVLQEGARLFFEGRYQPALAALEAASGFGPEVTLQPHVHLFRAAALHALFVRSGESDLSLRARAEEEIAQCRRLNRDLVPDDRFSPRFVAFFQSSGTEAPDQPVTASR